MNKYYLDAGTTWSKIIEIYDTESHLATTRSAELIFHSEHKNCFIVPSVNLKSIGLNYERATGHMSDFSCSSKIDYMNEVIALAKGVQKLNIQETNYIVLDLGSRDAKWVRYKNEKFCDLDWNSSCASATGATVEMLLKFYNVKASELKYSDEKYNITCGIFGLEKIMDDIASGECSSTAISKFVHGVAFNSWNFAQKPMKIYLSGGFCNCDCFVTSLKQYCEVTILGRFVLCEGLIK